MFAEVHRVVVVAAGGRTERALPTGEAAHRDRLPPTMGGVRLRLVGAALRVDPDVPLATAGGALHPPCAQMLAHAGQTAAGAQVEFPAVQLAGERLALHYTETGQVSLEVRAPALHQPTVQFDVLGLHRLLVLVVPALGVLQALLREALEERVDELVVLPDPRRREPAGEEERV